MRRVEIGLGLWSMQATFPRTRSQSLLYAELVDEARLAEELGFDSLWISEHHAWHDGYCPAPLVAAAHALGATSNLGVGTAVLLLPLYEPATLARQVGELHGLSGGRFRLGVAIGYRTEEFDLVGVDPSQRADLVEAHLVTMRDAWGPAFDPDVWMGGASSRPAGRAARTRCGFLLPPPLPIDAVRGLVREYREAGGTRVGIMRDLWVAATDDLARAQAGPWTAYAHRQYAAMEGLTGAEEIVAFQRRAEQASVIGAPETVLEALHPVMALSPDLLLLRVRWGDQDRAAVESCLRLLATAVVPRLGA